MERIEFTLGDDGTPVVGRVSVSGATSVNKLYDCATITVDRILELESEIRDWKGILQKVSDKLQEGGEFDDELRRLLFSV